MSVSDIHMPLTDSQAKFAIEDEQSRVDRISKRYVWLSNACYAIAAFIAGTVALLYIKGHPSDYTVYILVAAGIIAYKGFDYLWESQLSDIRMAEWSQDNGMRALNQFELLELKRFVATSKQGKLMLHAWQDNQLTIRIRDKDYLLQVIIREANLDLISELEIVSQ